MILAVGELEEEGERLLTPEERLYRLENQVAALGSVLAELISCVGVANSYVILDAEGADRSRVVQEAKKIAADLGELLQRIREFWPVS